MLLTIHVRAPVRLGGVGLRGLFHVALEEAAAF
jgi:hypothetical protein